MSGFKPYPAYKDSGVEWLGEVPEYWGVFSLKRSLDGCVNGIWGAEADGIDDLAVIRVADFDRQRFRVGLDKLTYRSIPANDRVSRTLQPGDLLIEKSGGGEKTLVGCVVLFEHDFPAVSSNFVGRMRPQKGFDSGFLCYVFCSLYDRRLNYPAIKQTTGIQNLDVEAYLQGFFASPPSSEQTQIARFLDHETARIDALIAEQERLIELLKEKRQAVISHAVTKGLNPDVPMKDSGVEWLGQVPAHWEVYQFKFNTLDMQTGPFGSQLHAEDYVDGGIPLVNPAHMVNGAIVPDSSVSVDEGTWGRLSRHALGIGDIIFARRGELGRCAIVTSKERGWLCGTGSLKARLNKRLSPEYAYLLMTSKGVIAELLLESKGSTMDNLNTETLGRVKVPVPPVSEQEDILQHIQVVSGMFEEMVNAAENATLLMTERRAALISAAVTGKIDVRDWRPPADAPSLSEAA